METIKIKLPKPVCRTPIPAPQKHKNAVKYNRKQKHKANNDIATS